MKIEEIILAVKDVNNIVSCSTDTLARYIKFNNEQTYKTFFSNEERKAVSIENEHKDLEHFAVMYICHVIGFNHDYGFNSTVKNINTEDVKNFLKNANQTIGEMLAIHTLKQNNTLYPCFQDINLHADVLSNALKTPSILTGLMLEAQTSGNHQTPRLLWLLLKHLDKEGSRYQSVMNAWEKSEYWNILQQYQNYAWLDPIYAEFSPSSSIFSALNNSIKNACQKKTVRHRGYVEEVSPKTWDHPATIIHVYKVTYAYGADVLKWINLYPLRYSYRTSIMPKNTETKAESDPSSGCLKKGTVILLANGKKKAVEDITVEDQVINHTGTLSTCSDELIVNEHVNYLYSINNDEPFMSLDHPILTQAGWKCLAPEVAVSTNKEVSVSLLRVGDIICKSYIDETGQIQYIKEKVDKINVIENQSVCYDLHFNDGYQSYFANGYCCYLNYPAITAERVTKNIVENEKDTDTFKQDFIDNRAFLETIFDPSILNYFQQTFLRDTKEELTIKEDVLESYVIKSLEIMDMTVISEQEDLSFKKLSLFRGHLFFDDETTPVAIESENNHLYAQRVNRKGVSETIMIRLYHQGMVGKGVVVTDDKKVCFTVTTEFSYAMKSVEGTTTKDMGTYTMGYKQDKGVLVPVGKWEYMGSLLADTETLRNVTYYTDKDKATLLYVKARIEDATAELLDMPFKIADLHFNAIYSILEGVGKLADDEKSPMVCSISGELLNMERRHTLMDQLSIWQEKQIPLAGQPVKANLFTKSRKQEIKKMLTLNTDALFLLPEPENVSDVHKTCFNKLKYMSLYCMANHDKEMFGYFGENKPTVDDKYGQLTTSEAKLTEKANIKDFLLKDFSLAYLTTAYSNNQDDNIGGQIKKVPNWDKRIDFYWKGSKKNSCLSAKDQYKEATNQVYNSVYKSYVTGLDAYVNQDPKGWARKLYNYCIDDRIIAGLVLTYMSNPNSTRILHLSTLMNILDDGPNIVVDETSGNEKEKKVSYAAAFYEKVINACCSNFVSNAQNPEKRKDIESGLNDFLLAFFKKWIDLVNSGGFSDWDEKTKQEAVRELNEAIKASGCANIHEYVNSLTGIVADIVSTITRMSDVSMPVRIKRVFENHPGVPKVFAAMGYGIGLFSIVSGFTKFGDMSPTDRTRLIVGTVNTVVGIVKDVAVFKACSVFKTGVGNLVEANNTILANIKQLDFVNAMATTSNKEQILSKLGVETANLSAEEASIVEASTRFQKFVKISSGVAKVFSLLTMAAATGFAIYQVCQDFASGQPPLVQALDIIEAISTGLVFVLDVGAGIAALAGVAVCSAIPIIGVVAAVVGVVVAIVALFIHRKAPPTPLETFVKERCVPYLKNMDVPDAEWVAEQEKIKKHLTNNTLAFI